MAGIRETGGLPTDPTKLYQQNFSKGLDLFQKSLEEYKKADEIHKKAKLRDVMDKALDVLNRTAGKILETKGQKLEEKLNTDYQSYLDNESQQSYNQLNSDIDKLRKFVP